MTAQRKILAGPPLDGKIRMLAHIDGECMTVRVGQLIETLPFPLCNRLSTLIQRMPALKWRSAPAGSTHTSNPHRSPIAIVAKGLLRACAGVDLFLPNLEEAEAITGHANPEAALTALSGAFLVVALKGGAQGAWISSPAGFHYAAAKSPGGRYDRCGRCLQCRLHRCMAAARGRKAVP
ncbi:carbohydrate kinase [Agrobacterium tumefaciens]|uniref:Carbohydrate kinase n=1 Tax=Agrobacterium tumefaciens TaxID=358 RepID=A0A2L2LKG5_AGRTU|nr:carbohydrate kinase [Agrobacterium tumefaciens]